LPSQAHARKAARPAEDTTAPSAIADPGSSQEMTSGLFPAAVLLGPHHADEAALAAFAAERDVER
jgi:hypothetical protein